MDSENKYTTHNGSLYDYASGSHCGVLIKEDVMRKLVKLQAKHLEDVKRLLVDEADKGSVFPSMWTLHHPGGVQTEVRFIDTSEDVYDRINRATVINQPRHIPVVFIADSMGDAERMADERYENVSD